VKHLEIDSLHPLAAAPSLSKYRGVAQLETAGRLFRMELFEAFTRLRSGYQTTGEAEHPRINAIRTSEPRMVATIEPRQPSLLEKMKNMDAQWCCNGRTKAPAVGLSATAVLEQAAVARRNRLVLIAGRSRIA
jgi:hypothetical protein